MASSFSPIARYIVYGCELTHDGAFLALSTIAFKVSNEIVLFVNFLVEILVLNASDTYIVIPLFLVISLLL